MITEITVEDTSGQRLDQYLSERTELGLSRTYLGRLIKEQEILVNGKTAKASTRVKIGDQIRLDIPEPETLDGHCLQDSPIPSIVQIQFLRMQPPSVTWF